MPSRQIASRSWTRYRPKHETVVITKHGKPVAKLVPVNNDMDEIYNFLAGKGTVRRRCYTRGFA